MLTRDDVNWNELLPTRIAEKLVSELCDSLIELEVIGGRSMEVIAHRAAIQRRLKWLAQAYSL